MVSNVKCVAEWLARGRQEGNAGMEWAGALKTGSSISESATLWCGSKLFGLSGSVDTVAKRKARCSAHRSHAKEGCSRRTRLGIDVESVVQRDVVELLPNVFSPY